jgi:hypothetical protein
VSGKRALKKQQKRQAAAFAQLEELYRRGAPAADDEILARAAELGPELAASPFAGKWAEVADRALLQSLAAADLGRLERLLRSLRRNGSPRPLAVLAQGVLDLAAGRLDGARASLAGAEAGDGGIAGLPPRLLTDLEALARDEPGRQKKNGAFPRALRAISELFATLKALAARAGSPTAVELRTLGRCLRVLRRLTVPEQPGKPAGPEVAELRRLLDVLDGADRCLSLLTHLATIETRLARLPQEDEERARRELAAWMRRAGPSLVAALGASGPPLLAPLQHAVALRWRGVLERVAARQGSSGLAALLIADPRLLAHQVDLPGGAQQGQEALRQRALAQQLLAEGRHGELAHLLRSRGRIVSAAGDLAALWSLELWARGRWEPESEEEDEDLAPELDEPYPHRTLVRLGEMAREIGRRIPAEQRAGVARGLAGELFDLGDAIGFCEHTAEAALALLEHRPGATEEIGLLLAGVAGATARGAPRALRALDVHLDRAGRAMAEHLPIARRLMAMIAREETRALASILDAVRPLFPIEVWPEIAELVAGEMAGSLAEILDHTGLMALGAPRRSERALGDVRRVLGSLRPVLGGTTGFAAVELILDCWRPDRPARPETPATPAMTERLARFLAAFPGWEGALTALRVLERAWKPWLPEGLELVSGALARAAIERLDDRWQLWCPAVPILAATADRAHLALLEGKMQQLLATPGIAGEDRERLTSALKLIREIGRMKHGPDRPRRQAKRPRKPRRRSGGRAPQLQLDFPGSPIEGS